jgi:hypothetical protein
MSCQVSGRRVLRTLRHWLSTDLQQGHGGPIYSPISLTRLMREIHHATGSHLHQGERDR